MSAPVAAEPAGSTTRLVVQSGIATAVGFGFCRFSVGLLLEPMRAEFGLSYTAAGVLASVNLASYITGALITPVLGRRYGYGILANAGLALGAVCLAALALAPSVVPLVVALAVAGFASALVWISVAALGAERFPARRRGVLLGAVVGSTGLGIVAAAVIGLVLVVDGAVLWRQAWGVQAALAAVAAVAVGRIARVPVNHVHRQRTRLGAVRRGLLRYYLAYAAFAAGYILFITYVVAAVAGATGDFRAGAVLWLLVGVGALPGAVLIGAGSDRLSRNVMLVLTQTLAAVACVAVVTDLGGDAYGARGAAVVIGAIMTGMGSLVPSLLADVLPAPHVPDIFASFTLVFAVVQTIAPVGGGIVIDVTGGFSAVFWIAGGLFAAAALGFWAPVHDLPTPS